MKYNIVVDGTHQAQIELDYDDKGGFTGAILHSDYGTGPITNGTVGADGTLKGNVVLDGYTAQFSAQASPTAISGNLTYGWFFDKKFTGTQSA